MSLRKSYGSAIEMRIRTAAVGSAELRLSNGDAVASLQFASDAAAVRSTVQCPSPGHLLATILLALLPPSVLDAEVRRGLSRLFTSRDLASLSPTMARAEVGSADGRLIASVLFAAFAATVGGTEILVTGTFVASWKCASSASTMSNTKPGGTLCALGTSHSLALPVAAVSSAVRALRDGHAYAPLNAARLSIVQCEQTRIHRPCSHDRRCRVKLRHGGGGRGRRTVHHALSRSRQYHRSLRAGNRYDNHFVEVDSIAIVVVGG
mmetsp:Transcript_6626/g.12006  ORF Transcript_6626/g.12006 Transcript_6626/m.12006 type:complete len:264 (-) Transcript_6626:444-1235(-)